MSTTRILSRMVVLGVSFFCLAACRVTVPPPQAVPPSQVCVEDGRVLNVGFYAFFAPVSYSADADPQAAGFNIHLGYEADLLTALEAMNGVGLAFVRHPITSWDDIWLQAAGPLYDIVGGGITILDSRTRDAAGKTMVTFTESHITYHQALLVAAPDRHRFASHEELTSAVRVGVRAGTTGEARLLALTGFVDADGVLVAGTQIETPEGMLVADGSAEYTITSAGASPSLSGRQQLYPPAPTMPHIIYLGEETGHLDLLEALEAGSVDAVIRGGIGPPESASVQDGPFVAMALDDQVEYGGFTLSAEDRELAACLGEHINWLTDSRRVGYAEWRADPAVFMDRAQMWNAGAR